MLLQVRLAPVEEGGRGVLWLRPSARYTGRGVPWLRPSARYTGVVVGLVWDALRTQSRLSLSPEDRGMVITGKTGSEWWVQIGGW